MYATSNLSHFFNIWNNKETPEEFSMKQTVTDIPAGVYKVTFDADGNKDVEPGIVLKVNGKKPIMSALDGTFGRHMRQRNSKYLKVKILPLALKAELMLHIGVILIISVYTLMEK